DVERSQFFALHARMEESIRRRFAATRSTRLRGGKIAAEAHKQAESIPLRQIVGHAIPFLSKGAGLFVGRSEIRLDIRKSVVVETKVGRIERLFQNRGVGK